MKKIKSTALPTLLVLCMFFSGCEESSSPSTNSIKPVKIETPTPVVIEIDMSNKGIGPITDLSLSSEIDQVLVAKGIEVFKANCTACHNIDKRVVGPALAGIFERRSPEWIMNMVLNPEEMVEKDPIAKGLFEEYKSVMVNQGLSKDEARAILEYFRTTQLVESK